MPRRLISLSQLTTEAVQRHLRNCIKQKGNAYCPLQVHKSIHEIIENASYLPSDEDSHIYECFNLLVDVVLKYNIHGKPWKLLREHVWLDLQKGLYSNEYYLRRLLEIPAYRKQINYIGKFCARKKLSFCDRLYVTTVNCSIMYTIVHQLEFLCFLGSNIIDNVNRLKSIMLLLMENGADPFSPILLMKFFCFAGQAKKPPSNLFSLLSQLEITQVRWHRWEARYFISYFSRSVKRFWQARNTFVSLLRRVRMKKYISELRRQLNSETPITMLGVQDIIIHYWSKNAFQFRQAVQVIQTITTTTHLTSRMSY